MQRMQVVSVGVHDILPKSIDIELAISHSVSECQSDKCRG